MKNKTKGAAQKDGGAVNAEDSAAAADQLKRLGKDGDVKGAAKGKTKGAAHDGDLDHNKKGHVSNDSGKTWRHEGEDPSKQTKMGAARGGKKGDISDATKAKEKKVVAESRKDYEGSPRMGYTQNFGAARQGGYTKGAAKVNSIMGKGSEGAAQK